MQPALLLAAGESVARQMERHFSSKNFSKLFNFIKREFKLMLDLAHQIKNFKSLSSKCY